MSEDFGGGDEIGFERRGRAGLVTLTRPKALNAVTHGMVRALARALDAWEHDDAVDLVIVRGEGRAFSAGGDIVHIYEAGRAGRPPLDFFADEYRLNHRIAAYPKPYVALIDGIAMGGGVGISYHGSHRVVTGDAAFAMPETGIGFFPDIGASFFLPRLRGAFGLYLALTGTRIGWGDQLWSGLATHAVEAGRLDELTAALCESGDAAAIDALAVTPPREIHDAAIHAVNKHFTLGSVPELVRCLAGEAGGDPFVARTLQQMTANSPTSLMVAFAQMEAGAALGIAECLRMEYRIVTRMLAGHDFYEGIRAAVIDKDAKPVWRPAGLDEVTEAMVDAYFAPLPDGELAL